VPTTIAWEVGVAYVLNWKACCLCTLTKVLEKDEDNLRQATIMFQSAGTTQYTSEIHEAIIVGKYVFNTVVGTSFARITPPSCEVSSALVLSAFTNSRGTCLWEEPLLTE
jgi:hypothetical protein